MIQKNELPIGKEVRLAFRINLRITLKIVLESILVFLLVSAKCSDGVVTLISENSALYSTFTYVGILISIWLLTSLRPLYQTVAIKTLCAIVSIVFSVFIIAGKCYTVNDISQSITSLFCSSLKNKAGIILLFVAAFLLCFNIITSIEGIASRIKVDHVPAILNKRMNKLLYGKHGVFFQALFMLLWIAPQVCLRYPGYISQDAFHSLAQYYGMTEYTTKHPIIYALTLGKVIDVGASIGHPNYGLFLLILIQTTMVVSAIVYTLWVMQKLGAPQWFCSLTLVVMTFMPATVVTATIAQKDTPFIIGFLLLMDELALLLSHRETVSWSVPHFLVLILGLIGLFYRHNGIYVALSLACVLCVREVYLFVKKRDCSRTKNICFIACILIVTLCGRQFNSYLIGKYDAKIATTRVIYSSTIQQIGRTLALYPEDVSTDDLVKLQKVLSIPVEDYANKYYPYNFNNLKGGFNQKASREELRNYLIAWYHIGQKHPDTFLAAILHQNYMLFSPLANNYNYYERMSSYWKKNLSEYSFDFSHFFAEKESLIKLQDVLSRYYVSYSVCPILGLSTNTGFYVLIYFGLCVYAITWRKGSWLLLALPPLVIMGFTFFGPAFSGNARYMYPLIWSMPLLLTSFFFDENAPHGRHLKFQEGIKK